jgi:hypothetical protein
MKREGLKIYELGEIQQTRKIIYVNDSLEMITNIKDDLTAGMKLFIVYPYKEKGYIRYTKLDADGKKVKYKRQFSMKGFANMLEAETGTKGVYYNADIDKQIKKGLEDVNDAWENMNFVITNKTITCGVNYDIKHKLFDKVYIFVSKFSTARDVIQVSYRPRRLTTGKIFINYMDVMEKDECRENDTHIIGCDIYTRLIENIYIENNCPTKDAIRLFANKAGYKQIKQKKGNINVELQEHMTDLLKKYNIQYSYDKIDDITEEECDKIKQRYMSFDATEEEIYKVKKYYFKNQFVIEEPNKEYEFEYIDFANIGEKIALEPVRSEGMPAYIWDTNTFNTVNVLNHYVLMDDNKIELFRKICEFNEFDGLFPPDITKLKLNEELMGEIFKEFKFRTLLPASSKKRILKSIYNKFFANEFVKTVYDKSKNCKYITLNKNMQSYFDFVNECIYYNQD